MTTASDNFDRADENPIAGAWTNYTGANKISSNVARSTVAFVGNLSGYAGTWSGDHEASCVIGAPDATDYAGRGVGPAVRIQTVDGSGNYGYALQVAVSDSRVVLQRAGDASVIVGAVDTADWADGDVAKLRIVGSTLTVYKNGTELYTRSSATMTGGRPGFAVIRSGQTVDTWVAADVVLGPDPDSVAPSSGALAGGTAITITGTGFDAAGGSSEGVTIGGTAATSVVFVNATTVTCVTPAGTAGAKNVVVTNGDATTGTLVSGYTYVVGPIVTPTSGTTNGSGVLTTGLTSDQTLVRVLVRAYIGGTEAARTTTLPT